MNVAPTYWILYLPASMSFFTVAPTVCSNWAQTGQRGSSYMLQGLLGGRLADDDRRAVLPVVLAGLTSLSSFGRLPVAGLVGLDDRVADAAGYRQDADDRAGDDRPAG